MDEDPILARARLLIAATNNVNQNDAINSMMGKSPSEPDELEEILNTDSEDNKQSIKVVTEAEFLINIEKEDEVKVLIEDTQKLDIDESNTLLSDPVLVRARLFVEASNSMNSNLNTVQNSNVDLTLDISVIDSNHLISSNGIDIFDSNQNDSIKSQSPSPSKKGKGKEKISVIAKCTVIQGSSLVSTSIDVRLSLKVGSSISIDGDIVQISDSIAEWSSNRIALKEDWPYETRFDAELFIESQSLLNRSPTKSHKNTALPVSADRIQNAVSQLDLFLSTRANNFFPIKEPLITKKGNKNLNKVKKDKEIISLIDSPGRSDYDQDNSDKISSRYIEDKIMEGDDVIEISRRLALKRVSQKLKEDQKQAAIDAAFKEEQQAVVVLVNERKAEELRRKTLERIAVQRGIKQALQLAQLEVEEGKRRKEEVAILKADERLHVMNALRMQTLKRMKAAKVKAQEGEELKAKMIAERIQKLSIETGRGTSVPSPFYEVSHMEGQGKIRTSLSAGSLKHSLSTDPNTKNRVKSIQKDSLKDLVSPIGSRFPPISLKSVLDDFSENHAGNHSRCVFFGHILNSIFIVYRSLNLIYDYKDWYILNH